MDLKVSTTKYVLYDKCTTISRVLIVFEVCMVTDNRL